MYVTPLAESFDPSAYVWLRLHCPSAKEFVSNQTQNVLVVGPNVTTRSDLRIFNADGGDLIKKMAASPDFFALTCQNLLERMINTVPRGVQLTDVITPIRIKPTIRDTILMPEAQTMTIWGSVRVSYTFQPRTTRTNSLTIRFSKTAPPVLAGSSPQTSSLGMRQRAETADHCADHPRSPRARETFAPRSRATRSSQTTPSTSPSQCPKAPHPSSSQSRTTTAPC